MNTKIVRLGNSIDLKLRIFVWESHLVVKNARKLCCCTINGPLGVSALNVDFICIVVRTQKLFLVYVLCSYVV